LKDDIINVKFYETAKSYVITAIRLIVSFLQQGEQVRFDIVEKNEIEQGQSYRTIHVYRPLFFELVDRHRKEFENLPEYQTCMKVMNSDPAIAKHKDSLVGTWNSRMRRTAEDYLDYLLMKQLPQDQEKIEFSPEIFDQAYCALERFFYSDTLMLKAFAPLHNFHSDVDHLDLGDNLQIRRITKREKEQLLDESRWYPVMPHFETLSLEYALELAYTTEKVLGQIPQAPVPPKEEKMNGTLGKLVTTLRLFKRGIVWSNMIRTTSTYELPIPIGISHFSSPYKSLLGEQYSLTESEFKDFREFWNAIKRIDLEGHAQLSIAIRRFNYAYERSNLEDKLIDFMVAFEALFFKEGESGEFQHRLSVRVSRFLEQEYEQRKLVAKKMREFYNERSKVVHGEKTQLKDDSVRTVEDYLRKSTKLFLKRLATSNGDDILTHLDLD
jgi:hypothetical protein